MRQLTGILIALAALLALPTQAGAARLSITGPDPGTPIAVHPHVEAVAAELELAGRAAPGALVEVSTRCVLGPCATQVVANRRGRWKAPMTFVRDAWRQKVTIRARYPLDASQDVHADYPVQKPPWASVAPYGSRGTAPRLAMIGDSLAVGTDDLLRDDLPGWRVTTDGRVGRPLAEGMALLGQTPLPAAEPVALAFSLFTNNDPRGAVELESAVRASVARLESKGCAIWATIVRPKVAGFGYRAVNRRLLALRRDPALHDSLLVVDWAKAVRHHREWLREDGIHPTQAGYARRAELYADAAEACREGRRWSVG